MKQFMILGAFCFLISHQSNAQVSSDNEHPDSWENANADARWNFLGYVNGIDACAYLSGINDYRYWRMDHIWYPNYGHPCYGSQKNNPTPIDDEVLFKVTVMPNNDLGQCLNNIEFELQSVRCRQKIDFILCKGPKSAKNSIALVECVNDVTIY